MKNAERISRRHFSAARIAKMHKLQRVQNLYSLLSSHHKYKGRKGNEKWKLFFSFMYDLRRR